jgi:GT2 family glycosyltransferase
MGGFRSRAEAYERGGSEVESGEGAASAATMTREHRSHHVSVLIPTYRDMHLLVKSLPVFLERHADETEIVVLNNDPAQDVPGLLGERLGPEARRRIRVENLGFDAGFARAINRGVQLTSGEFLLICNADLFPTPTYIDVMHEFFATHPRAGLATGKILRYDLERDTPTDTIDTVGLVLSRNRRFLVRGESQRDVGQFDETEQVFGVDGAALFARRSAFEDVACRSEYFDESFFMYKEDWDLSWRVRLAGWECWYVPAAVAYHARTSRGLGDRSYLGAVKLFHENERAKSPLVRFHSLKNQWLMLLKNEDGWNFLRDFPFILGRELTVLLYNAVFAPLAAVPAFVRLVRPAVAKRRLIKRKQVVAASALRPWLERQHSAGGNSA